MSGLGADDAILRYGTLGSVAPCGRGLKNAILGPAHVHSVPTVAERVGCRY